MRRLRVIYGQERWPNGDRGSGALRLASMDTGQAGRLAYGAGTMALVCLKRSFQPLICWRVRMKTALPTGGTPYRRT